jgi:hypothetical protein
MESRLIRFEGFMARPYGGLEVEIIITLIGLSCAISLMYDPILITSSQTFLVFWGVVPGRIISVPWLMSSLLTLSGLALFYVGNQICAPLRFSASIINCFIWSWVFWFTYITDGSFILCMISFWLAMACIRLAAGAWHRPWPVYG